MDVVSHDPGELASSSSNSFLGTDEAQTSSSSNSAMSQAVATFPLSFLMPNCSALQGLDQQVVPTYYPSCAFPAPPPLLISFMYYPPLLPFLIWQPAASFTASVWSMLACFASQTPACMMSCTCML